MRHMDLKRLTNAEYMAKDMPLRIYRQTLYEPASVHWHEFYELGFVLAGRGVHCLNGVEQPLQRGSIFLLTPADFHSVASIGPTPLELFDIVFLSDVLKEEVYRLLFQDLKNYTLVFPETDIPLIEYEFQRLWSESQTCVLGSSLIMIGTLERILIDLARKSFTEAPVLQGPDLIDHQKLRMSLIYLHHHFREALTLEEVAAQVHLSSAYFSEYFHRTYGSSFQHYLQELRLRFAQSLLSTTSLPISAIYAASGFQSLSHFERTFKQHYGQSPRQFRKGRQE